MEKLESKKITKVKAVEEINDWLKFKGIRRSVKEENESTIDDLAECMVDGLISIDPETKVITQKLTFPLVGPEGNKIASEFKFKPRVPVKALHINYKGINPKDTDAKLLATIETFSDESKNVLNQMDPTDYGVTQMIAVFYLPQ